MEEIKSFVAHPGSVAGSAVSRYSSSAYVDRTHGFEFGAHFPIRLDRAREFIPADASDCRIGEQVGPLDASSFRQVSAM